MAAECMSFPKTLFKSHVSPRYYFNVPKKFSKEHMPIYDCEVVLVDESERAYPVSFTHRREDEFTTGWEDFVVENGLLEGDELSFLLIAPCRFKVSRGIKVEPQDEDDKSLDLLKAAFVSRKRTPRKVITSFEKFKICANGEVLDSKLPTHVRIKYFELCRVQDKLLHKHLIDGVNAKSVIEMILEITKIVDAMVDISISTPVQDLDRMVSTLHAFEYKGMAVGYLRDEISSLVKLAREHQTVEESSRPQQEELEMQKKALTERISKIDELIVLAMEHGIQIGDLERNLDPQMKKMADLSLMFKEVTERMGKSPR